MKKGEYCESGILKLQLASASKGGVGGEAPCIEPAGGLAGKPAGKLSIFSDLKPF